MSPFLQQYAFIMTGKAKFGFRIPKEFQALPFFYPPQAPFRTLGGLIYMHACVAPILLMAILGPTSIHPAAEFIIHKRVDSGERPKQAPGLGRKWQYPKYGIEPGSWALGWVQQLGRSPYASHWSESGQTYCGPKALCVLTTKRNSSQLKLNVSSTQLPLCISQEHSWPVQCHRDEGKCD